MSRPGKSKLVSYELQRMTELVTFIAENHLVGLDIIEGRISLDAAELAEMYNFVRPELQTFATADELSEYYAAHNCAELLPRAAAKCAKMFPARYAALRACAAEWQRRSFREIAEAQGIDTKTLYRWRRAVFQEIAENVLTELEIPFAYHADTIF